MQVVTFGPGQGRRFRSGVPLTKGGCSEHFRVGEADPHAPVPGPKFQEDIGAFVRDLIPCIC